MSGDLTEMPEEIKEKLAKMAYQITESLESLLAITQPITKKHIEDHEGKWPIEKQYLKLYEETGEAEKAFARNLPGVDQEHMDIMFSFLTLMHFRNNKKEELYNAILECLIKFERRGWI